MAYVVLKTFADVEDNKVTIQETKGLGNPTLLPIYKPNSEPVTYGEWLQFAMQMFSAENIAANKRIFSNQDQHDCGAWNTKLLERVPADLIPYSFMITLYYDQWGAYYVDGRGTPIWQTFPSLEAMGYLYASNSNGNIARLDDAGYWDGITLYLKGVKEFFNGAVWLSIKNKKTDPQYNVIPNNAMYWPCALLYARKYLKRTTGLGPNTVSQGTVTACDAMAIIAETNGVASLTFNDGYWFLICPISVSNKASLYSVFPASTDVVAILGGATYKKKTIKKGDKEIQYLPENQTRIYGVELELTSDLRVQDMIDKQGDDVFFLCKSDASIRGSKRNCYECVTRPMSLPDHRRAWSRFFSNVGGLTTFDQTTNTNNGMHVHIDKTMFTDGHLRNFCWFMTNPAHIEFMIQLSQRTVESFNRWAPVPRYENVRTELQAWKQAPELCRGMRGACNTGSRSKRTVEVRLFKGIVSCAELIRNIEVVDAFFEFTRVTPWRQLTLRNFYEWVKATPRTQYKLLRADLYKLEMDALIRKAEIHRLVFGLGDPEAIVNRVNREKTRTEKLKEPFEVDSLVLSTVTRIIGRKVFGLSDDGDLTLLHKNIGRLAHLDSLLTDAYAKMAK